MVIEDVARDVDALERILDVTVEQFQRRHRT